MTNKKKEEIVKYYKENYPDMDEETLRMCIAMDASEVVAYYVCDCGRRHEIEHTPEEYGWSCAGSTCACGHEIKFGK